MYYILLIKIRFVINQIKEYFRVKKVLKIYKNMNHIKNRQLTFVSIIRIEKTHHFNLNFQKNTKNKQLTIQKYSKLKF